MILKLRSNYLESTEVLRFLRACCANDVSLISLQAEVPQK